MPGNDPHRTVTVDGYTVTFHPAFASRCTVTTDAGQEKELYKQKDVYHLPKGQGHPKKHRIELTGGDLKRNIKLAVDDPDHQIASITVELYGPGHVPGSGEDEKPVESFTTYNGGPTCPPNCSP